MEKSHTTQALAAMVAYPLLQLDNLKLTRRRRAHRADDDETVGVKIMCLC